MGKLRTRRPLANDRLAKVETGGQCCLNVGLCRLRSGGFEKTIATKRTFERPISAICNMATLFGANLIALVPSERYAIAALPNRVSADVQFTAPMNSST